VTPVGFSSSEPSEHFTQPQWLYPCDDTTRIRLWKAINSHHPCFAREHSCADDSLVLSRPDGIWRGLARMLFALTFASAFGASGYWLLLRLFWLKSLRSVTLITTIAMCCPATLLGWFVAAQLASAGPGSRVRDVTDLAPTFAWWAAFSLSLYYSDAQRQGGTSIPAVAD